MYSSFTNLNVYFIQKHFNLTHKINHHTALRYVMIDEISDIVFLNVISDIRDKFADVIYNFLIVAFFVVIGDKNPGV